MFVNGPNRQRRAAEAFRAAGSRLRRHGQPEVVHSVLPGGGGPDAPVLGEVRLGAAGQVVTPGGVEFGSGLLVRRGGAARVPVPAVVVVDPAMSAALTFRRRAGFRIARPVRPAAKSFDWGVSNPSLERGSLAPPLFSSPWPPSEGLPSAPRPQSGRRCCPRGPSASGVNPCSRVNRASHPGGRAVDDRVGRRPYRAKPQDIA